MQLARFSVQTDPVPVEHAIRGVRVLLNLEQHEAGANRMKTSARQKHRVSLLHSNTMHAVSNRAVPDAALEFFSRNIPAEADKQFSMSCGIGDVPHLGLWLATELSGDSKGRMNLQRKNVLGIENFNQQREAL